jgi:hypothetical protein
MPGLVRASTRDFPLILYPYGMGCRVKPGKGDKTA